MTRNVLAGACLLIAIAGCGGSSRDPGGDGLSQAPDAGDGTGGTLGGSSPDGGASGGDAGVQASADAGALPPAGPSLAGCPMFPADSAWNLRVDSLPVDPNSKNYLAFMGAGSAMIHPDFGSPEYGQPFAIVSGDQARVPMSFRYAGESDPGPYPYPQDVPIQTAPDRHAMVLDRDHCLLYETYLTNSSGSGGFTADSGALFDLRSSLLRHEGWTSATAAGLPILPGLARFDEVMEQGAVLHALAFTAGGSAHSYVHPATHSSGTSDSSSAPPLGLRVRLRADYDLSRFHGASLVLLRGLQRYGMFLTDNAEGSFWSVAGSKDPRWPTQDLEQMKSVPVSAFEVIQLGPIFHGR